MDQLAHLIIRVDGQGVEKAAKDLDGLRSSSSRLEMQEEKRANRARDEANKIARAAEIWKKKYIDAADAQFAYDSKIAASAAKRANALERSWQTEARELKKHKFDFDTYAKSAFARDSAIAASSLRLAQAEIEHRQRVIAAKRAAAEKAQRISEELAAREARIEAARIARAERDAAKEAAIEARRVAAAQEAERKIQEARQKSIDQARLLNRFSGTGGGWGGGGSGGGSINGVPIGSFGQPKRAGFSMEGISSGISPVYGMIGGALSARAYIDTAVEMETLNARIKVLTGSTEAGNAAFAKLMELDRQLPTNIKQLSQAFLMLANMGLEPSERALRSYSDIATASGATIEEMAFKIQRATEGEFKPLRELGVSAEIMGDKIKMSFRGVSETMDNNVKSIEDYFIRLGENNFAGLAAAQMDTLGGAITNLQSAWESMVLSTSKGGVGTEIKEMVKGLTWVIDRWGEGYRVISGGVGTLSETLAHETNVDRAQGALRKAERDGETESLGRLKTRLDEAIEARRKFREETEKYMGMSKHQFDRIVPEGDADLAKYNQSKPDVVIEKALKNEQLNIEKLRTFKLKFANQWQVIDAEEEDNWKEINSFKDQLTPAEFVSIHDGNFAQMDAARKALADKAIKSAKAIADKVSKAVAASFKKKKEDEDKLSFFIMGADEEGAINAKKIKTEDWIYKVTAPGSERESKALSVANDIAIREFTELAERRKNILRREYEDRERLIRRAFKDGDGREVERINKSKANWEEYVASVAKISVGDGSVSNLDAGEGPSFPGAEDMALKAYSDKEAAVQRELSLQAMKNEELNNLYQQGFINQQAFNERSAANEKEHQARLREMGTAGVRRVAEDQMRMQLYVLDAASGITAQLSNLAQGNTDAAKAAFFATKSLAIAQAIINTHLGMSQAYAMGPIFGIPAAMFLQGVGYANVAIMAATSFQEYAGKFAEGGIVGGNSFSGDRMTANVNSGEMILNSSQQRNLFDAANGRGGAGGGGNVYIFNNAGVQVQAEKNSSGDWEIMLDRVDSDLASRASTGKSKLTDVLQNQFNLRRSGRSA